MTLNDAYYNGIFFSRITVRLVSAFPPCLHITWRQENVRVRHRLWNHKKQGNNDVEGFDTSEQKGRLSGENGGLTDDDLNAWALDDLLQELWIHVPTLANALQEFRKLKELEGDELRVKSYKLNLVLKEVQSAMMELWNSDRVTELLRELELVDGQSPSTSSPCPASQKQTHPRHTSSQQVELSASPIPYHCKFRLAGYFRLTFLSIKSYIPIVLQRPPRPQPLRTNHAEMSGEKTNTHSPHTDTYFQDHEALQFSADEMCRTFAGLEESFPLDMLMPCSYPLTMACFSCSRELREWLWLKFEKFEEAGVFFGPLKSALVTLRDYLPEELGRANEVRKRVLNVGAIEDTTASIRDP